METRINADGTTEVILTPLQQDKSFKDTEVRDPLKKPVALDDGRWAVICWYIMLPLNILSVSTIPDCRKQKWNNW